MIGEPVLVAANININSCYCGRNLKTIQLPESCIFLGVVRKGKILLLSDEDIEIWCGDYLMAIAFKPSLAPALKVILHKTHHVSWFPSRSRVKEENERFPLLINFLSSYPA
jgi:uncharacterized protein with PhoU and TrkA domain